MKKLKKRQIFLGLVIAWCALFYHGVSIGYETDRSHEPQFKPWIGRVFRLNEPTVIHQLETWRYRLDRPTDHSLPPDQIKSFLADPKYFQAHGLNSADILRPGTLFKITKILDWSTWAGGPSLIIRAVLLTGPYDGKTVQDDYLFDHDWKGTEITGSKGNVLTQVY
jgi:hypothetical protein